MSFPLHSLALMDVYNNPKNYYSRYNNTTWNAIYRRVIISQILIILIIVNTWTGNDNHIPGTIGSYLFIHLSIHLLFVLIQLVHHRLVVVAPTVHMCRYIHRIEKTCPLNTTSVMNLLYSPNFYSATWCGSILIINIVVVVIIAVQLWSRRRLGTSERKERGLFYKWYGIT